ncbi:MAG: hypothetical protein ABI091_02545 [Ferruginibacter sp.]
MRILYSIFFISIFSGCIISKRAKDKSITRYARNNQEFIKEAATFSIAVTLDKHDKKFYVKDVEDSQMRTKISSLGTSVTVTFQKDLFPQEIPDSNVTFYSVTNQGLLEVIYDFASRDRIFPDNVSSKSNYYFVKVADRIYYKRSYIPQMVH